GCSGQLNSQGGKRTQEVNPMLNDKYSTGKNTSIPIQKSLFGPDRYLADSRQKLAQLYFKNPQIAESEKKVIASYWQVYEGLAAILGDKWQSFYDWFLSAATSSETITRCFRALKTDGTIKLDPEEQKQRQEKEQEWRQYWGNERIQRDNNGRE
ncbi:hypothetical protein ACFLVU_05915, partial [Chloroflexota bacterium]